MHIARKRVAFATLSLAALWAGHASAQTASEVGALVVTGGREVALDTVSTTGSRLGLDVRETPATIDILTQERFIERGLRTSNEALNSAPGVTAYDPGGSPGTVSMRGFGGNSVSLNYDGVHQPSTMVSRNYDAFAFDRIEVLKGPSSVLFGEGALGGSINLVPKKPELGRASYQALGQYGSRDTYRVAGDVNLPVSDTVAVRAVVSYAGNDGHVSRANKKSLTANLGLTWQPTSNLTAFFAVEHFWNSDTATYWGSPLVSRAVARDPSDEVSTASGLVFDNAIRRNNYQYADALVRGDSTWLRSQISWKINSAWTLKNDLSYNNGDRLWRDAESYSFVAATRQVSRGAVYIRNPLDFWQERLMLSSDGTISGHRNRFLIGFEHGENRHHSLRGFGFNSTVDPYNFVAGVFPSTNPPQDFAPLAGSTSEDSGSKIVTNGVFGENAFNISDKWLFVAGGRYESMQLDRDILSYKTNTTASFDRTYKPFSFRLGTVYSVTPKTQVYAQYNQSAVAVGTLVLITLANSSFELTKGKSAEVGVKSSFWNNRISATLAGYWISQDNIITRDPTNPNVSVQGGSQSSRGVELAVAAAVTRNFTIDGNVAIVDAYYDKLLEAGGVNRAGNSPNNVPAQIYNLFATYRFNAVPVKLTAGLRRSNHIFGDTANTTRVNGYTVFDASIGYATKYGDITVRGRNLTNQIYFEAAGANSVYWAQPRSVDVTLRTKF
jgi:iron complex outermembrane receptor protein